MGLDACVYRSRANLPFDPDAVGAVLDTSTGEYYFPDPAIEPLREREFPRDTRIAVEKRIGNIETVALLRNKTQQLLDHSSLILSKVLYSGVHAIRSRSQSFLSCNRNLWRCDEAQGFGMMNT